MDRETRAVTAREQGCVSNLTAFGDTAPGGGSSPWRSPICWPCRGCWWRGEPSRRLLRACRLRGSASSVRRRTQLARRTVPMIPTLRRRAVRADRYAFLAAPYRSVRCRKRRFCESCGRHRPWPNGRAELPMCRRAHSCRPSRRVLHPRWRDRSVRFPSIHCHWRTASCCQAFAASRSWPQPYSP